ncbi:MAG: pre-peptidase C-terminal domain-containing protein, partial [Sulfurovum sp.]|nr:pre-peptidase C-terminal domain-containing protein [Sulfurovum sp.]
DYGFATGFVSSAQSESALDPEPADTNSTADTNRTTSGAEATASGNNPNDDGNNRETARTISPTSTISGNIETAGDVDYFTIKIPSAGTLVVETTGFADTNGSLLDASGTPIATDDDNGSEHNFKILTFIQDAGTYSVKVKRSSASSTGHYTLISQFTPDDHGDTKETATSINPNSTTSGYISRAGDVDWFKIVIPSGGGALIVSTTGSTDTVGIFYDASGTPIGDPDDNGSTDGNFQISERNVIAGTYYVSVKHSSASSTGHYTLISQFISDDHGNTKAKATSIDLNSTTSGSIEIDRDKDWFKIQIPSRGTLVVETTGSTDTNGSLYNVDGDEIATDDNNGSDNNFRIEHNVTAGIYYVKVKHSSASSTGSYELVSDDIGGKMNNCRISQIVTAGTYYIKVKYYSASETGSYLLVTGFTPQAEVSSDHGDSRDTATPIDLNSTTSGSIDRAGDNDWFKIVIPTTGTLTVYTTGSGDTAGYLYDTNGTQLVYNDDVNGTNKNFGISQIVTAGTYYVRVKNFSGQAAGNDYTLIS